MPTPVVAGNWKMNTSLAEATALAAGVRDGVKALARPRAAVSPEVYQTPVAKLSLSPRTHNCLIRADISNVGAILEMTDADLLKIRNFGEKSLEELHDKLAQLGIRPQGGAATALASGVEVILCPPFVSLAAVREAARGSSVKVGAQNMHFEKSGAFTGEISPAMLQGLCDYVILGHSERRQLFGETDDLVNHKVRAAFAHGLRPILCVGETLAQREGGRAAQVVGQQVKAGLAGVPGVYDITGLVVAYEPVWAIGTGRAATPEIAAEVMGGAIAGALRELYGAAAGQVPLLYGGSVNPGNAAAFAGQASIHGALVGGASLQAAQFVEIARLTAAAKAAG